MGGAFYMIITEYTLFRQAIFLGLEDVIFTIDEFNHLK
jgi:hypothetical protein